MKNRTEFYITRALIGLCEGYGDVASSSSRQNADRYSHLVFYSGFIPGAVLYTSFFYKTGELAIRLSLFWYVEPCCVPSAVTALIPHLSGRA